VTRICATKYWAEWIAWKLEEAGYSTVTQAWDFKPGGNFVLEMHNAATIADRTIAVLSQKYLESSCLASPNQTPKSGNIVMRVV